MGQGKAVCWHSFWFPAYISSLLATLCIAQLLCNLNLNPFLVRTTAFPRKVCLRKKKKKKRERLEPLKLSPAERSLQVVHLQWELYPHSCAILLVSLVSDSCFQWLNLRDLNE